MLVEPLVELRFGEQVRQLPGQVFYGSLLDEGGVVVHRLRDGHGRAVAVVLHMVVHLLRRVGVDDGVDGRLPCLEVLLVGRLFLVAGQEHFLEELFVGLHLRRGLVVGAQVAPDDVLVEAAEGPLYLCYFLLGEVPLLWRGRHCEVVVEGILDEFRVRHHAVGAVGHFEPDHLVQVHLRFRRLQLGLAVEEVLQVVSVLVMCRHGGMVFGVVSVGVLLFVGGEQVVVGDFLEHACDILRALRERALPLFRGHIHPRPDVACLDLSRADGMVPVRRGHLLVDFHHLVHHLLHPLLLRFDLFDQFDPQPVDQGL